jgi:hypothetical protein
MSEIIVLLESLSQLTIGEIRHLQLSFRAPIKLLSYSSKSLELSVLEFSPKLKTLLPPCNLPPCNGNKP